MECKDFVIYDTKLWQYTGVGGNLTIPDGITHILEYSFKNVCCELNLIIPDSVNLIEHHAFADCQGLKSIVILSKEIIIGSHAFAGCVNLEKILLPDGLKNIYPGTFMNCKKLKHINLPDSIEQISSFDLDWETNGPFAGCENLKTISIPSRIDRIYPKTFDGCRSLKKVEIHGKVRFPEDSGPIFEGADHAWIDLPCSFPNQTIRENSIVSYCELILSGTVDTEHKKAYRRYLKSQRKRLYSFILNEDTVLQAMLKEKLMDSDDINYLLNKCSPSQKIQLLTYQNQNLSPEDPFYLQEAELEASITGILPISLAKKIWTYKNTGPDHVILQGYKGNDEEIFLPNAIGNRTISGLGNYAFSPASSQASENVKKQRINIRSIVLSDHITEIGEGLCKNCVNLTHIEIPQSCTTIKREAFYGCSLLKSISIPESVRKIEHSAFLGCTNLEQITLPDSIQTIGSSAFYNCTMLKHIILPKQLKEIEYYVFENCNLLEDITFNYNLQSIAHRAFEYCISLKTVKLPPNLTEIGEQAFHDCIRLKHITIPEKIEKIAENTFEGCKNLVIHAPVGSYAEYYALNNNIPFADN